jgi:NAD(P)-dependent dehydrogenase (short-subunit alcohol dehydrogenase family)
VNLIGSVWCLKHSIRQMLEQGKGGAILLTASTSALIAGAGTSSYAATKWGILGLMKTAAMEYATDNIRVNALCPAITRTDKTAENWDRRARRNQAILDLIPMGRMAELHEQADAAVFLCSSRASFITGVALPVDGGQTMGGVQAWD